MTAASRPLNILLVHERFPPDYAGGGEYVVLETARHLQQRGHAVRVLTTGDPAITEFEGIAMRRLPISRYRLNLAAAAVRREALHADLIHAFTYHGLYPAYRAGKALDKPVVCGVLALFGEVWREMRGPLTGRLFETMEHTLLKLPMAARIFLSEESRQLAASLGLARSTDIVIEPAISLADYRAQPDKACVIYAGKLDVRKGIDTVLDTARHLPDIPFRIVGWGERYAEIEATKPANVSLVAFRDRQQLAAELSRARIFLFPTKAETFGLIVAEAMASGCAIVSTSTLPFAGIKLKHETAEAIVMAVQSLWHDQDLCSQYGSRNQQLAQRYSWDRHASELEAVYCGLLDAHREQRYADRTRA
jgi:glycosyltransferase involved in cell wall biosynthesis